MTDTITDAWATLQDYIDGQDDLTDEQCAAVDTLTDTFVRPLIPVGEVAAAIGLPDADEEGILPGSAADQCAAIYELLGRYGIEVR